MRRRRSLVHCSAFVVTLLVLAVASAVSEWAAWHGVIIAHFLVLCLLRKITEAQEDRAKYLSCPSRELAHLNGAGLP